MSYPRPPKIELPGKPTYLSLAVDCDFFGLFKRIEQQYQDCFLLESLGEESYVSRHHIMGFSPTQTVFAKNQNTLCPRVFILGKKNC